MKMSLYNRRTEMLLITAYYLKVHFNSILSDECYKYIKIGILNLNIYIIKHVRTYY